MRYLRPNSRSGLEVTPDMGVIEFKIIGEHSTVGIPQDFRNIVKLKNEQKGPSLQQQLEATLFHPFVGCVYLTLSIY